MHSELGSNQTRRAKPVCYLHRVLHGCRLELAALVLWSLLIYSLPAHKEFRFLLPALVLLMPYCGIALDDLASRWRQHSAADVALLHHVSRQRKLLHDWLQNCPVLAMNF